MRRLAAAWYAEFCVGANRGERIIALALLAFVSILVGMTAVFFVVAFVRGPIRMLIFVGSFALLGVALWVWFNFAAAAHEDKAGKR